MKLLKTVIFALLPILSIVTLAVTLTVSFASSAFAQDGSAGTDDISLFVGSMLPNQIDGVNEILPVFGGRYGFGTRFGMIELGGANTHARGVEFTTAEASFRHDVKVDEGLLGLISGGLDFSYYTPENQSVRKAETGFHIAAGGMMMVSKSFWLRTDLKFLGGPGTSLSLLFGFVIRDPSGGGQ